MNELRRKYERVMSHICMHHVTRANAPYCTYETVMSHIFAVIAVDERSPLSVPTEMSHFTPRGVHPLMMGTLACAITSTCVKGLGLRVSAKAYMNSICSVLQCVAGCCSVLQCVTVCACVLQCCCGVVAVCCSVLQCAAVCCSVLQCVAVCCSVLQCVAEQAYLNSICVWGRAMMHVHMCHVVHLNMCDVVDRMLCVSVCLGVHVKVYVCVHQYI